MTNSDEVTTFTMKAVKKVAFYTISTWATFVANATHWYARITVPQAVFDDGKTGYFEIEVRHKSDKDLYQYSPSGERSIYVREGEMTDVFSSRAEAEEGAQKEFARIFGKDWTLVSKMDYLCGRY